MRNALDASAVQRIEELVRSAPTFTATQRDIITGLFGGASAGGAA